MPQEPITDKWGGSFYRDYTAMLLEDRQGEWNGGKSGIEQILTSAITFVFTLCFLFVGLLWYTISYRDGYVLGQVVGRTFILASFPVLLGLVAFGFINSTRNQARFDSDLKLRELRERTRLEVASKLTAADVERMAKAANLSVTQMQLYLAGYHLDNIIKNEERVREDEKAEKDRAHRRAQDRAEWDRETLRTQGHETRQTMNIQADNQRAELRLHNQLAIDKAKEDILVEKQKFDMLLGRIKLDQGQSARMAAINEITEIRKTIVASVASLRENPSLKDEISGLLLGLNQLQTILRSSEAFTSDDMDKMETVDNLFMRLLLKRYDLNDHDNKANVA